MQKDKKYKTYISMNEATRIMGISRTTRDCGTVGLMTGWQSRFQGSSSFIPLKSWELGSEKSRGYHAFIVLQVKEIIMLFSFSVSLNKHQKSWLAHGGLFWFPKWTPLVLPVCQAVRRSHNTGQLSRKSHQIRLEFTHKNGDFGAISLSERCCPSPIS